MGLAEDLVRQDDRIDQLNREIFTRALDFGTDPDRREWSMHMMLIGRAIERIGDNAVDIGEQTAFVVTGLFREFEDASHPEVSIRPLMPLRLLQGAPDPGALYDLFRDAGENVAAATATLSELIEGWPEDPEGLRHKLVDLEHEGDRLTHDIYHRLLSEAHTPVDHTDALSLASELDDVVDLSEEVGDFLALYRIEAPMDQAVQLAGVLKLSGAEIGTALAKLAHPDAAGPAPHRAGAAGGRRRPRRARGAGLPVRRGRGPHGGHTMEGSLRATRAGHRCVRARGARARGHRPEGELSSSPVLGCIDIGSNTTRLLVAQCEEGSLRELASQRAFTRVGKSLKKDGRIPKKKIEEIAAVVAAQARAARESGARAAGDRRHRRDPRRAEPAGARRRGAQRSGGGDLRVVSGDEEARLAFVGAARTLTTPADGHARGGRRGRRLHRDRGGRGRRHA